MKIESFLGQGLRSSQEDVLSVTQEGDITIIGTIPNYSTDLNNLLIFKVLMIIVIVSIFHCLFLP